MPTKGTWIALGVGAYVAFVLALFPAAAALRAAAAFGNAPIDLAGVEGTLWSGGAAAGSVGGLPVRDVRWQVDAWPLLLLRISGRVQARLDDGFLDSGFALSRGAVRLEALRASGALAPLAPLVRASGTQGQASAQFETLELIDGWPTAAVGELRLAQLQAAPIIPTGSPGLVPLGDYTVRFGDTGGRGLAADIRDAGGPLEVAGTLTLDLQRRYAIDAYVKPRPDAPQILLDGIDVMAGEPDASGRRRLTLTGSL